MFRLSKNFWFGFCVFLVLALNLGLILDKFNRKNTYHVDEIWSYAHANSTQGPYISYKLSNTYLWLDPKVYHRQLTVQREDGFKYNHIYRNLADDMHTPLYFMLFYTINWFFPDQMSIWTGAGLNIVLWLLTLWATYRLSRQLIKDKYMVWLPVFLYAFSLIGISTVLYIRVYMLQTLLATLLLSELISYVQCRSGRCLFLIFLYSTLGMLTSYVSVVFSFLVSVGYGLYLLFRKQYRLLVYLAGAMFSSLVVFFVAFPPALRILLRHMAESGFFPKVTPFLFNLSFYFTELFHINIDLWKHDFVATGLLILLFYALVVYTYVADKASRKIYWPLIGILFVTHVLLVYGMPEMYEFNNRYTMFLYPAISVVTIGILFVILCRFIPERVAKCILAGLVIVNVFSANYDRYSPYLLRFDEEEQQILQAMEDKNVIIVSPVPFWFEFAADLYPKMNRIYFLPDDYYRNMDPICREHKAVCRMIGSALAEGDYLLVFNALPARFKTDLEQDAFSQKDDSYHPGLKYIKSIRWPCFIFDVFQITDPDWAYQTTENPDTLTEGR